MALVLCPFRAIYSLERRPGECYDFERFFKGVHKFEHRSNFTNSEGQLAVHIDQHTSISTDVIVKKADAIVEEAKNPFAPSALHLLVTASRALTVTLTVWCRAHDVE